MSNIAQPLWWQDFSVFFYLFFYKFQFLLIFHQHHKPWISLPWIVNDNPITLHKCFLFLRYVVVSVINKFALVSFPLERSCKKKLSQSLLMSAYEWVIRLQTLNNISCNHVYSIEPLHKVIYPKYYKHWN